MALHVAEWLWLPIYICLILRGLYTDADELHGVGLFLGVMALFATILSGTVYCIISAFT